MSALAKRIEPALARSEPVRVARSALAGAEGAAWVVGGTVRDALLGRPLGDVDLAVAGSPAEAARALAAAGSGHRFELSGEFATWRVSGPRRSWTIDVSGLRGESIEADLRLRDFTVNAVAVPLAGGGALDPTGGIADLDARCLRAASARSLEHDPLRLLRAARLAAELGLAIEPDTAEQARRLAARAAEPAGERRFAELRRMVAGPDPLRALELLDQLAITPVVLPHLDALKGVVQSPNHHLDVHGHTIEVLRRWLAVEADLPGYVGPHADAVAAALEQPLADELSRRDGIRFAAILHDIGKPATRTEQGGLISFRGHDALGAKMIRELCAELRTSRRFADYQAALARHHLVLGFMVGARPLGRRRIWDYLTRTGRDALDVTLLTVADRLSARGTGVPERAIEAHLELAREMIGEILALEREGPPEPLLGGAEIAALLGLEPGPRIGEAVRELAAAQFAGEVSSRQEAERHLHAWLEREHPSAGPGE